MSETLRARMRKLAEAHETSGPEELARLFLRMVHVEDLEPLVVEEFKRILRYNTRVLEIEVLRNSTPLRPRKTLQAVQAALEDLAPLLDEPYAVGDGRVRRFGALTIQEHEIRIQMLRGQINGLQRDIELHERAIEICVNRSVSCLDDVEEAAA